MGLQQWYLPKNRDPQGPSVPASPPQAHLGPVSLLVQPWSLKVSPALCFSGDVIAPSAQLSVGMLCAWPRPCTQEFRNVQGVRKGCSWLGTREWDQNLGRSGPREALSRHS